MQIVGGGANYLIGKYNPDPGTGRVCQRHYLRVSDDFTGTGYPGDGCPTERNKIMQIGFNSGGSTQVAQVGERADFGPGTSCGPGIFRNFVTTIDALGFTQNFSTSFSDCDSSSGWCRFEQCVSGNMETGTGISIEVRITPLSTGISETKDNGTVATPVNFSGAMGQFAESFSADIFHGQGTGGDTGEKWISHFMEAHFPTNSGQWIGAACEIEGGC